MKVLITTIFNLLLSISIFAQGVNVKAFLDSTSILIGQELKLHIEAEFLAQDTIQWPAFSTSITENIEILNISNIDTSYDENDVTIKRMQQHISITSFDSGYFAIPPISFDINGKQYDTEPLLIQVFDMPVDTAKGIADIKEPYQVPFSLKEWIAYNWRWIALGIVVALIVIGAVIYFRKRKNNPTPIIKQKPKIPPHKIAVKRLKDLEHRKLWQNGKTKAYHSELSDIIREYLEYRYEINALESTTFETIQLVKQVGLASNLIDKLNETLSISDMVKFAKETPLSSDNEVCIRNCYEIVEATIPSNPKNTDNG